MHGIKNGITLFNLDFHLEMKIKHKNLSALNRYLNCDYYAWTSTDIWEGN
jgi:hypothetical protein